MKQLKGPQLRLLRVWACMRLFFVVLLVISIILLVEYIVNLSSQLSENVGWVALGLSSLLCAVLTRPPWRARLCVFVAGVGHKVEDKKDAEAAATLIWVNLEPHA